MDENIEETLDKAETALRIFTQTESKPRQNTSDLVRLFCVLMSTSEKPNISECIKSAKQIYNELNN